jgi:O-antigen/teichoic acid export membrane protein
MTNERDPVEGRSLRQTAAWGAKWTGASTAVSIAAQFAQVVVLARLLDPREFGLAASVVVIIGLASAFADMGISQAIIAKRTTDRGTLSSLYWASVASGIAVGILVMACIPLITGFYDEPKLAALVPLAAVAFPITALGQQFMILLQKDLQFHTLAKIETTSSVARPVAAIGLALLGVGAAAIIGGYLANVTVKAGLLVLRGARTWCPGWRFRVSDLDGYIGFGLYQMGAKTMNYLGSNMDYLLIGRFREPMRSACIRSATTSW